MRRWLLPLLLMFGLSVWFPTSSNTNAQDECAPSRHEVGSYGWFGTGDVMYSEPSSNSEEVTQGYGQTVFMVVSEAVCVNGVLWIEGVFNPYDTAQGWLREHAGYGYETYLIDEADALNEPCESVFEAGDLGEPVYYSRPIYENAFFAGERLGLMEPGSIFTALGEFECVTSVADGYFGPGTSRTEVTAVWTKIEWDGVVGWIEEFGSPMCDAYCQGGPDLFTRPVLAEVPAATGQIDLLPPTIPAEWVITADNADDVQAAVITGNNKFIEVIWNPNRTEYAVVGSLVIEIYRPDEDEFTPVFQVAVDSSAITRAGYNYDGTLLGVISNDGTVGLWETETYTLLYTLQANRGGRSLAFSPDGRWLAVNAFAEGTTLISLPTDGGGEPEITAFFERRGDTYLGFSVDNDLLMIGGLRMMRIDPETAAVMVESEYGMDLEFYSIVYVPQQNAMIFGAHSAPSPGQQEVYRFGFLWAVGEDEFNSQPFSWVPEGFFSVSTPYNFVISDDSKLFAMHTQRGIDLHNPTTDVLSLPDRDAVTMVFSPDSQSLALVNRSGEVKLYDPVGREIRTFESVEGVNRLRFSADSRYLTGFSIASVVLWSVASGEVVSEKQSGYSDVQLSAFNADSRQLIVNLTSTVMSGSSGRSVTTVGAIDTETGVLVELGELAIEPSRFVLQNDMYGEGLELKYADTQAVVLANLPPQQVQYSETRIVTSDDGQFIAYAYEVQKGIGISVLDLTESIVQWQSERYYDIIENLTFSPDGRLLALKGKIGTENSETPPLEFVHVWDVMTGTLVYDIPLIAERNYIVTLDFSVDGQRLAWIINNFSEEEVTINRLDLANGDVTNIPVSSETYLFEFTFNPDTSLLVATDREGNIWVLDATTSELITTLNGHAESVSSFLFSPDGTKFASRSGDGTIIIWALEE